VNRRTLYLILGSIVLVAACTMDGSTPVEPTPNPYLAKGGGGSALRAVFIQGDYAPGGGESLVLTPPGCSGAVTQSYNVDFRADDCLWMTTTTGLTLADDAFFAFNTKGGSIVGSQFWIDDQAGADGIGHESDKMTIPAQANSPGGFTLHVHARNVPVWRLGGHLSKKRVVQVGTVSIGDVVFYVP
jgi:hypothetical protein